MWAVLILAWPTLGFGGVVHYVSKAGTASNANDGLTWNTAWATPKHADSNTVVGDTIVFGAGTWDDVMIHPKKRGRNQVPRPSSVWACSSWYANIGNPAAQLSGSMYPDSTWKTRLYGGKRLSGFTKYQTLGDGDTVWTCSFTENDVMPLWEFTTWVSCLSQGPLPDGADSLLVRQLSLADVDQPGEFYHSAGTAYLIPYGNVSTSLRAFYATAVSNVYFAPTNGDTISNCLFYGLDLRHGWLGTAYYRTGNSGAVSESTSFQHCFIGLSATEAGSNPACVGFYQTDPYKNRWNSFVNCRMDWALEDATSNSGTPPLSGLPNRYAGSAGGGVVLYSAEKTSVDSCVLGPWLASGVHFKNDNHTTNNSVGTFDNNHLRFCTIRSQYAGATIDIYPEYDSVYGNTFIGTGGGSNMTFGVLMGQAAGQQNNASLELYKMFIANNTFYGLTGEFVTRVEGLSCGSENKIMYNVGYKTVLGGNGMFLGFRYGPTGCYTSYTIDSNYWYSPTYAFVGWPASSVNWTAWRGTYGFDTHGFNANPGFTNAAIGDFSRPSATSEMNQDYGGRHWTTYGAVQSRRVYYVRTAGSDAADGKSWATAWQTNAKVQATVTAGDTVIYGRGFYFGTNLDPPAGGSNSAWTVYACSTWIESTTAAGRLAGKNLAVLSGGDRVTGWTAYGGGVWRAPWTPTNCNGNANNTNYCVTRGGLLDMEVCVSNGGTIGNVTAPLDWAHTGGYLYYYPPAAHPDPNSDTIIAACNITVEFATANVNHVRIWGLGIRNSYAKNILWNQDGGGTNVDSCFIEHCAISHATSQYGGNPANVGSNSHTASIQCDDNYVRACSLSHAYELDAAAGTKTTWTAMTWYHMNRVVVESCYFDGTTNGCFWKDSTFNCSMRYNTMTGFAGASHNGYYAGPNNDSCYGNVIYNTARGLRVDQEEQLPGQSLYILNNTFYNVGGYFLAQEVTTTGNGSTVIRYNVFYRVGNGLWNELSWWTGSPGLSSDYNLWYDEPVSSFSSSLTGCGSNRTWAQWQACGLDLHSVQYSPGFVNAAGGDFTRSDPPLNEISADYAGRHWSVMGAIQPGGGPPPYVRTNYYVSPGGDDDNSGAQAQPWQTMLKACTTAQQNDTVFIYPGTYRSAAGWYAGDYDAGTLAPTHAGTDATHPLVFRSVPGMARPIIEGQIADGQKDRHAATITQSYIVLDSLIFRNAAQGIYVDNATDVTIRNCVVDTVAAPSADPNTSGIIVGATNTVTNLWLQSDTVRYIRQRTGSVPYAYYDTTDSRGVQVVRSRLSNYWGLQIENMGTGKGIEFTTQSDRDSVYSCRIKNCGVGIAAQSCDSMRIFLNVVSYFDSIGIRLGQASSNPNSDTRVFSNTVYAPGPSGGAFFMGYLGNTINSSWDKPMVYDNIFMDGGIPAYRVFGLYGSEVITQGATGIYGLYEDYNLAYNLLQADYYQYTTGPFYYTLVAWRAVTANNHALHDISDDPLFVDAAAGDFRLMYASPARTASSTGGVMGALTAIGSSTFNGTRAVTLKGVKRK
jgi:hypothetical protein